MDVLTAQQRSHCMSRIRGKNTKPEKLLRKALWAAGLRYRLHGRLPGKPDLVFSKAKVSIFIDGCFWHGCPQHGVRPKTNKKFWNKKIGGNKQRDVKVRNLLKAQGWVVVRFWEHEIKNDIFVVTEKITKITRQEMRR